ncbi:MAG: hypothetical protein Q4B82_09030 [Alysiella sp.]|uniref:hypothetical protein n=1 Tax=Alysiella sp. TaxID=1872483 RepID=UPI0026DA9E3A|nr:hypothetical protein [Alysiella sp.]MDO4434704.1 hypothetical protein [Alysiella sp.]
MEKGKQSRQNIRTSATQYRANANVSPPRATTGQKSFSGSLKHWLGGMVNNPTTGALSSDKVWYNVMAGAMTWQFLSTEPAEWKWVTFGSIVGGASLIKRGIAGIQQVSEKRIEKGD